MNDLISRINLYLLDEKEEIKMTKDEATDYISDLMESLFKFLDSLDTDKLEDNQKDLLQDFLYMYDDSKESDKIKEAFKPIKKDK